MGEPEGLLEQVGAVRERRLNVATAFVDRAHAELEGARRHASALVMEGDPAEEILSLAQEPRADLIILGARGASLIRGLVVGSVADRVLKSAPCSVLIVH